MRGEHYSKRPQPEENSGTYAYSPPVYDGSAVRLLLVRRCHNHQVISSWMVGTTGYSATGSANVSDCDCVEGVRKGYV
jgi:hypothetical protein